jgi:hypothetical protein
MRMSPACVILIVLVLVVSSSNSIRIVVILILVVVELQLEEIARDAFPHSIGQVESFGGIERFDHFRCLFDGLLKGFQVRQGDVHVELTRFVLHDDLGESRIGEQPSSIDASSPHF